MMLAALALLAAGGCRGRPAEPLPAELARHDEPVRLIEFGTPAARELLREGWWRDESDGGVPHLWTGERRARLLVPWGEPGEVSGQIVCRRLGAALDPPQTVRITCRGRELAVFAPEPV